MTLYDFFFRKYKYLPSCNFPKLSSARLHPSCSRLREMTWRCYHHVKQMHRFLSFFGNLKTSACDLSKKAVYPVTWRVTLAPMSCAPAIWHSYPSLIWHRAVNQIMEPGPFSAAIPLYVLRISCFMHVRYAAQKLIISSRKRDKLLMHNSKFCVVFVAILLGHSQIPCMWEGRVPYQFMATRMRRPAWIQHSVNQRAGRPARGRSTGFHLTS